MPRLGVNIDHVATLREARRVDYPDPVEAALAAERAGAGAITFHLREDRRHVQDRDLLRLRQEVHVRLNQELAPIDEMVELALKIRRTRFAWCPSGARRLPPRAASTPPALSAAARTDDRRLKQAGLACRLFIDPEPASRSRGRTGRGLRRNSYGRLRQPGRDDLQADAISTGAFAAA